MDLNDLKLFATFYIESDEILSNKEKIDLMEFVKKGEQKDILYLLMTGQKPGEDLILVKESSVASAIELVKGGMDLKDLIKIGAKTGVSVASTRRHIKKMNQGNTEEKPWGHATIFLAGVAASSLAASLAFKMSQKKIKKLLQKCEKEKGMAKKVCNSKIRRDGLRMEITMLSSMKTKCRGTKEPDKCIKNIDKRIKTIQNRMDSIKVF